MSEIICTHCQTTNEFHVVQSGPHLKAVCDYCNQYIKFIPQEKEPPRFYFGKYIGKYIHEIEDLPYLKWALANLKCTQYVRDCIQNRISSFENLAR